MTEDKKEIAPAPSTLEEQNPTPLRSALLSGALPIGNVSLHCAVLDDETRIVSATSMFRAFKKSRYGATDRNKVELDGVRLPTFLSANNLKPYITEGILDRIKPIQYQDGATVKSGYDSALLPDLCEMYLRARRDGVLTPHQEPQAEQAEILLTAFAKVGIAAVIDEATGYQIVRTNDALMVLLSRYVAEGLQKWVKTFPDSFFTQLDRLYDNEKTDSRSRPMYYGRFITTYVYDPIENGYVKAELDKLNINDDGTRKARFHQWLSDVGREALNRQIGRVEARMEMCDTIEEFRKAEKGNQKPITIAPYLFDETGKLIE